MSHHLQKRLHGLISMKTTIKTLAGAHSHFVALLLWEAQPAIEQTTCSVTIVFLRETGAVVHNLTPDIYFV
jgi:hypothetical protein